MASGPTLCRNRGANRRGSSGHSGETNHWTVAGLDDRPNVFVVARRTRGCYGIGETPAPNRQGAVTNAVCSLHGNDIDSDGACVTGPQPYSEGENESFAGMLPVPSECGLEPKCRGSARQSSGGWMPRPAGRGGGHTNKARAATTFQLTHFRASPIESPYRNNSRCGGERPEVEHFVRPI